MAQVNEAQGKPKQATPNPNDSSIADLSDLLDYKLTISSATVERDIDLLAARIRGAAKLDEGATGLSPTAHTIELIFTGREASSLDVYAAFGDWLEDLSQIVKDRVAEVRPRPAFPPPDGLRTAPGYARNTTMSSGGAVPSRLALPALRASVTQPAHRPNLQATPADAPRIALWENFRGPLQARDASIPSRPTLPALQAAVTQPAHRPNVQATPADAPRIALWENFRSTPQAPDASRSFSTQAARDRILEACQNYDSD